MKPVHLIGVPLDLGGNRRGTDMGPSAFRIAGIGEQIAKMGVTLLDKGDVSSPIPENRTEGDRRKRYVRDIARVCHKLYQMALASFADGAMPIVLGGDHSLGAGSVAAVACGKYVESLLFGLDPGDPRVLGGAAAVLLCVALMAAGIPAFRAGSVNPVSALRHD